MGARTGDVDADADADADGDALPLLLSVLFPEALRASRMACEYFDNDTDSSSFVSINATRVRSSGAGLVDSM